MTKFLTTAALLFAATMPNLAAATIIDCWPPFNCPFDGWCFCDQFIV